MTPHRPLRTLHVGVSNRGEWPLRCCAASEQFESVALCDVEPGALEAARQLTAVGASRCFESVEAALEASGDEIDCAILCSPTRWHVPQALACLERGVHVLVEKGMASDWVGACRLVNAVRRGGAKLCVAQNYRYNAMERTVVDALKVASHPAHPGKVHQVTYSQQRVRPEPRSLDYPFAAIWDMSCHHLDNLGLWFGQLNSCMAHAWGAEFSQYAHPSNTSAILQYEAGPIVHYLHAHDAARDSVLLEIHGDKGCLSYRHSASAGGVLEFSARPTEQFGVRPVEPVHSSVAGGEAELLHDCFEYFSGGPTPGIAAESNLETMAGCEMMVRSIAQQARVTRAELDR